MKQILSGFNRDLLDKRIIEAELQTKAQIVVAIIKRCDNYAEIPWKAFAIGASAAGLAVATTDLVMKDWITDTMLLLSVTAVMATGTLLAVLTLIFKGFARLFLPKSRRESETRQYAESLFLSRELFTTEGRKGILLLVSQFERQVVILPDTGVRKWLSAEVMKIIISKMTPHLRQNDVKNAMETGLDELVTALSPPVATGPDKNELSNEIIEEDAV
jgi:putative membrane protein